MNMNFIRKLPIPKEIKEQYPLTPTMAAAKSERDRDLRAIFRGESDRFLLIVGPCSADKEDSVLDYVSRLRDLAERVREKILIVPRVYTGKPRTMSDGYQGILHQPDPSEKPDLLRGIVTVRNLHMRVLAETGLSAADEMLYPENHRYLSDLLSYVSVGARSVEDQQHRFTASGLNIPVGMKNPTSGDLSVMLNAITAAQHPHDFIYRGWEVRSEGNPLAHAILRGHIGENGAPVPNYDFDSLSRLAERYAARNLKNPAVLVDCNHGNSGKDYLRQPQIAMDVLKSRAQSGELRRLVKGLMIESYLEDGAQSVGDGVYGKSITDACLGWEKTEALILAIADRL